MPHPTHPCWVMSLLDQGVFFVLFAKSSTRVGCLILRGGKGRESIEHLCISLLRICSLSHIPPHINCWRNKPFHVILIFLVRLSFEMEMIAESHINHMSCLCKTCCFFYVMSIHNHANASISHHSFPPMRTATENSMYAPKCHTKPPAIPTLDPDKSMFSRQP